MYRVRLRRIDCKQGKEDADQDKRNDPCMLHCVPLPLLKKGPRFPPLGERLLSISLILCLLVVSYIVPSDWTKGELRTLIVPGDGGLTSRVANAGALVSPALISPPSPLDRRRILGFSVVLGPPRGVNLSAVDSNGNASVAVILAQSYTILKGPKGRRKGTGTQKTEFINAVTGFYREALDEYVVGSWILKYFSLGIPGAGKVILSRD